MDFSYGSLIGKFPDYFFPPDVWLEFMRTNPTVSPLMRRGTSWDRSVFGSKKVIIWGFSVIKNCIKVYKPADIHWCGQLFRTKR